jgi:hypothetical protein
LLFLEMVVKFWKLKGGCIMLNILKLWLLFNYKSHSFQTQRHIAELGRKALFAISNTLKNLYFNVETQCLISDTYVNSILSYACEVWGFHKAPDIKKMHLSFCKKMLGVSK